VKLRDCELSDCELSGFLLGRLGTVDPAPELVEGGLQGRDGLVEALGDPLELARDLLRAVLRRGWKCQ
jgi:hypothetical protein